ncbi:hypothetical protein [Pseudoalteromonas sp. PS5]|uniref:hypothetical protein n=1 Tax=Pseudoalteromonas sp. PS5 TaxID=1437473 RepID=UPI000FFE8AF8|nr:hypothetical protein [Pseudoalteromonas sp. PS5]RXF06931.1 hypothetical protein D9603_00910 [Pseudoalteromonas sp. PS5]
MEGFFELSVKSLSTFPLKENIKGELAPPDLVFDFYLFPKVFINNRILEKLSPFFKSNIEIQEGAVELKFSELELSYCYLYVVGCDNDSHTNESTHIFRSEDNSSLFLSNELIKEMRKKSTNGVLYRWN